METVKFSSKFKSHRIVLKPQRHRIDSFGNRELVPGISCQFENGVFETNDPIVIEALKKHRDFGMDFFIIGAQSAPSDEAVARLDDEAAAVENIVNACPHCTFKAKTNLGLKSHIRAQHPGKS